MVQHTQINKHNIKCKESQLQKPYKNEYRICRPIEITVRMGFKGERRKIEGINEFGI
jgi:hypothetical protein